MFKDFNLFPALSNNHTVKHILNYPINTQRESDKSSIYRTSCKDCDKVHVCQIQCNLSIPCKEYSLHTRNKDLKQSGFPKDCIKFGHSYKHNFSVKPKQKFQDNRIGSYFYEKI